MTRTSSLTQTAALVRPSGHQENQVAKKTTWFGCGVKCVCVLTGGAAGAVLGFNAGIKAHDMLSQSLCCSAPNSNDLGILIKLGVAHFSPHSIPLMTLAGFFMGAKAGHAIADRILYH